MGYELERRVAVEAVIRACQVCQTVRAALVSPDTLAKKDRSPVTIADFAAQAVVGLDLLGAFPDQPMIGEEDAGPLRAADGADMRAKVVRHVRSMHPDAGEGRILDAIDHGRSEGGTAGRFWTLDPIDGTKGFLRDEQYAVALALIEDGEVVLGVLGCPNLPLDPREPGGRRGCVFAAVRGEGATVRPLDEADERPVRVCDVGDPVQASFCESVESGHTSHDDAARIADLLGVAAPPVRMDSQCKYAAVARGEAAIYLRLPTRADYEEKVWDHAAGWRIVIEAGGRVSDTRGAPIDFSRGRTLRSNRGVIVTNRRLHDAVLNAVSRIIG